MSWFLPLHEAATGLLQFTLASRRVFQRLAPVRASTPSEYKLAQ